MNVPLTMRRLSAAAALVAASLALTAAPANAQPVADPSDRVITVAGQARLVLEPQSSTAGAAVNAVPRIGRANETPDKQVWKVKRARQGGTVNLVHAPSEDAGRELCIDVLGDSLDVGANLVLRPCDGTDSQAWRQLSRATFNQFENQESKLKMEVTRGGLVQADFPARDDADRRVRTSNQQFNLGPKSFGIGGA